MGKTLLENYELQRVMTAQVAGTDDTLLSDAVDATGAHSVVFIVAFGTITATAVTSIKVSQCDTTGGSYADLLGSSISVAADDDNQIVAIEITNPREAFLKCSVVRATANAVVDGIVALTRRRKAPVTHNAATVVGHEIHNYPAEGTA